jgi:hypothetical protein
MERTMKELYGSHNDYCAAVRAAHENALRRKSAPLEQEYQRFACYVISHLRKHRDVSIVRHLLNGMPRALSKKSMSRFIGKYAPVSFDTKGIAYFDKTKPFDLAGAITNPWCKGAIPAKQQVGKKTTAPFVLLEELKDLHERASKRYNKRTPDIDDEVTPGQLVKLQQLISSLEKAKTKE